MHSHEHCDGRNPICCIIPPHMLEVLAMRGDKKTRSDGFGHADAE